MGGTEENQTWTQMQVVGDLPEPLLNHTLQYGLVLHWLPLDFQPHEGKSHSEGTCTVFPYAKALRIFLSQEG